MSRISDKWLMFCVGRGSKLTPRRFLVGIASGSSCVLLGIPIGKRWRGIRIGGGVWLWSRAFSGSLLWFG